jgi:mRNA interferase RelE/StbE
MSGTAGYDVHIKASAEKEMLTLPRRIVARTKQAILALEMEPRPRRSKKLRGREEYRLRVGDYRILYLIDDVARKIEIVAVGHRKDVYEP